MSVRPTAAPRRGADWLAVLYALGWVAMPCGLVVIGLGWWGASGTRYAWEQQSYLISGGLLGLAMTCSGGMVAVTIALVRLRESLAMRQSSPSPRPEEEARIAGVSDARIGPAGSSRAQRMGAVRSP